MHKKCRNLAQPIGTCGGNLEAIIKIDFNERELWIADWTQPVQKRIEEISSAERN
jgi:hypothetical protein